MVHQTIDLSIDNLGVNGEGVGRLNGLTLFVPGALPGERVRARVVERKKSFGRAQLLSVVRPSPHRAQAPCRVYGRCGGCQLMHLGYSEQLAFKTRRVAEALDRIGGFKGIRVEGSLPSPDPLHYRNKIQVPVRPGAQGRMEIGFFEHHSHRVVDFSECPVHQPLGDRLFQEIKKRILAARIAPYDEMRRRGFLRHILMRTSEKTGEALLILVTRPGNDSPLPALARRLVDSFSSLKGVVHNIQPQPGNTVLGRHFRLLAGRFYITEEVSGLAFRLDAPSFFQINTAQTENLVKRVITAAGEPAGGMAVDAYCGVGLFSLHLARRGFRVVGVESVPQAVECAKRNAAQNGIAGAEFVTGYAERLARRLPAAGLWVVDPPSKGCDPALVKTLVHAGPKRLIYVSCDPATLARDLRALCGPYGIEKIEPLDMFPQTAHVETVATLQKKGA